MHWFIFATASALLSTAATLAEKKSLFTLRATEFSFFLSLVLLTFSLWIPFYYPITSVSHTALIVIITKSVVGAAAFLLVMMSLERNEISSALPLLGTTPAVTALIAFFLLGEFLSISEWIGITLMFIGTLIIEKKPGMNILQSFRSSKTQFVIAGAVLLFALSSVADRYLLARISVHPSVVLFYQHCIYTIVFAVVYFVRQRQSINILTNNTNLITLLITVAILTFGYRYFQLEATKDAPAALVLAVKRTSILYASLAGGLFFNEKSLKIKIIGAVLIVSGGFFILRHVS